eukprot:1694465-Amphidinium_carterae.1
MKPVNNLTQTRSYTCGVTEHSMQIGLTLMLQADTNTKCKELYFWYRNSSRYSWHLHYEQAKT